MLRFRVFKNGSPPPNFDLSTACLVGSDSVPIRGEFFYENGEIICRKHAAGPAALSLLWETKNFGSVILETTRLPERDEPYNLNLELARGRVMRLLQKRQDWGLSEVAEAAAVNEKSNEARDLLLEAIIHQDDPAKASALADQCLQLVMPLSEQTALTHADLFLQRRIATKSFPRGVFGVRADPDKSSEQYRRLLLQVVDFVRLPMPWKQIEPREQQLNWGPMDEWVNFLHRARIPIVAGAPVRFKGNATPDWLYMWEHDYETIRDLLYEHIERVVSRYSSQVFLWTVLSGLHVNSQYSFTFDQIMDITRMVAGLIRKTSPTSRSMIEITEPFGEYYATNQRSLPPFLYAEMMVQSGIQFDIFGVTLRLGIPRYGCWVRDLFQISSLLDRFASLEKPVMISALQIPSAPTDVPPGSTPPGFWRQPWSESLQSKWLEAVTDIALSKPFVEAICWHDLVDNDPGLEDNIIPHGGLAHPNGSFKRAAKTWMSLRHAISGFQQIPPGKFPSPPRTDTTLSS